MNKIPPYPKKKKKKKKEIKNEKRAKKKKFISIFKTLEDVTLFLLVIALLLFKRGWLQKCFRHCQVKNRTMKSANDEIIIENSIPFF